MINECPHGLRSDVCGACESGPNDPLIKCKLSPLEQIRADVEAWIALPETTYVGEDYGDRILECVSEIESVAASRRPVDLDAVISIAPAPFDQRIDRSLDSAVPTVSKNLDALLWAAADEIRRLAGASAAQAEDEELAVELEAFAASGVYTYALASHQGLERRAAARLRARRGGAT